MNRHLFTSLFLLTAILAFTIFFACPKNVFLPENPPNGCSIITLVKGDSIFFAGNDDYINPDSYYWVDPASRNKYGVIWIGTPDNPQQGVNEKGLAYDANGLPRINVNPYADRIPVHGPYHNYCMKIMHECATVEEVIVWVNRHQRPSYMHDQLHFADATGDAVIISADKDGEIVFTRKEPGDGFLISTNFNRANPLNGYGYPCSRFNTANLILNELIGSEKNIDYKDVTHVMDEIHVEGASWTIETMVADLVNGLVYIYYFYQYDRPVILNVKQELENPRAPGPLSQLFPADVQEEAERRYQKNISGSKKIRFIGLSWLTFVILGNIFMYSLFSYKSRKLRFWIPVTLILGPMALIVRVFIERGQALLVQKALIETMGNLVPIVCAYILGLTILILNMFSGNISVSKQILSMFGLPLLLGLIFQALFLSSQSKNHLIRFLWKRLPQFLVHTFLAMGGIIAVTLPLINQNLDVSLILPLSPIMVLFWWAIVVLGAVLGGLITCIFELWAVKSEFYAWTILESGKGMLKTAGWKNIWWWMIISVIVLLVGIYSGAQFSN